MYGEICDDIIEKPEAETQQCKNNGTHQRGRLPDFKEFCLLTLFAFPGDIALPIDIRENKTDECNQQKSSAVDLVGIPSQKFEYIHAGFHLVCSYLF